MTKLRVGLATVVVWLGGALSLGAQPPGNAAAQAEAQAQTAAAQAQLHAYLNDIGYRLLDERAKAVAAITSKADAEARRAHVRTTILSLVGGLPAVAGPVKVRSFATVPDNGFHVENIAYESAPGYWVTANVYVPDGPGPFPAIVVAPGHGAGKASQYAWAANFARAGMLTLAIDPMGQGERLQHFDPELGASKIEPSGEHEHANQTTLLAGQHIARYWFADGMRGVDYLTQRRDVTASRIGTFGCSGGGTAAAYLAALDSRIAVAAVASFITSFKALLPGNGPQDAEQTLPGFLSAELDFADWVELAAPRPYAIVAFEQDFFPIAGARATAEEAKRLYSLHGASDNLQFIEGQGGHCNLGPVTPQVLAFLSKHLKGPDAAVPAFTPLTAKDTDDLLVTPTGQLSTSIGSATAAALTRKETATTLRTPQAVATADALALLQTRVRADIRKVAAVTATPAASPPAVTTTQTQALDGYRLESFTLESEPGITLRGAAGVPSGSGAHAAVLWMDATPIDRIAASPDFVRLVRAGRLVVAVQPRGVFGEPPPNSNLLALGPYMPELLRAIIVGRTLVGMRVDDTVRAIDWIAGRPDVDRASITVYGRGAQGMVALHAAALDTRITDLVVENTLVSYRAAFDAPLHRNLSEVDLPGVLQHYDTADLLQATSPRRVTMVNPSDAMGLPMRLAAAKAALAAAFDTDRRLGRADRVRLQKRGFRDPVPIALPPTLPERFETQVQVYEAADKATRPPAHAILLVGDSQLFRWKTLAEDLPGYTVINRGIDSFQFADVLQFYDRLVGPYQPRLIVLHVGGNDIHNGKSPERVLEDFKTFVARVRATSPAVPIAFSSITPGPGRWDEADRRKAANQIVKRYIATQRNLHFIDLWDAMLTADGQPREDLWVADRIHPNHDGYLVRVKIMQPLLGPPDHAAK